LNANSDHARLQYFSLWLIAGRVNLSSILRWRVGVVVYHGADAFVPSAGHAAQSVPQSGWVLTGR